MMSPNRQYILIYTINNSQTQEYPNSCEVLTEKGHNIRFLEGICILCILNIFEWPNCFARIPLSGSVIEEKVVSSIESIFILSR